MQGINDSLPQNDYAPQEEEERIFNPRIGDGEPNRRVLVLSAAGNTAEYRCVDILNIDQPEQAYQRLPHSEEKILKHGGDPWGILYYGQVLPRISEGIYQELPADQRQEVAIKKLQLPRVISEIQQRDVAEDPFKEIHRMQTIGSNHFVLGCIEALLDQDSGDLYIMSPRYAELQPGFVTVDDNERVQSAPYQGRPLSDREAKVVLRQLLEAVTRLHETHGICHADISLSNVLINNDLGRVLLIDLAMSFRIPQDGISTHDGRFGKPPYWLPEICSGQPYNARARDVHACIIIVFELLTGRHPYRLPLQQDLLYLYFVWAGGISTTPDNDRSRLLLQQMVNSPALVRSRQFEELDELARKVENFSPELLQLFENTLCVSSEQRWTADQILSSAWMQGASLATHEQLLGAADFAYAADILLDS
jgi:serine/threonine protein kinase